MYIVYELKLWPYSQTNDFAITNYLFEAVQLTKNSNIEKYSYSGYGIRFDVRLSFLLSDGSGFGKYVIIFGVGNSSSAYVNNKKRWLKKSYMMILN